MITSPESGWRDDGLYVVRVLDANGEAYCDFFGQCDVLTKRGKVRKSVVCGHIRMDSSSSMEIPHRVVNIFRPQLGP